MESATTLPVEIHRCVVTQVDRESKTCDIVTLDDSSRRYSEVPWSTPLADRHGNGVDIGPGINYVCYAITRTSNMQSEIDDSSVIIAWEAPATTSGTYGEDRESLGAGDVKLSTRRGGRLLLAANSGDVLMQAGPANSIILYRLANLMEVLCDALHIDTLGGGLKWGTVGNGLSGDSVFYDCHVKSKVGDEAGFVRFYVGEDQEGGVAHFRVMEPTLLAGSYDSNDNSDMRGTPSVHVDVKMSRNGDMRVHARESFSLSATRGINLATEGEASVVCNKLSITTKTDAVRERGLIESTNSKLSTSYVDTELKALDFKVIDRATGETLIRTANPDVVEGRNKRLLTEDLVDWIFNHTHPTNNGPTLAPLGAPADASISEQRSAGSGVLEVQASEVAAKGKHISMSVICFTIAQLILQLKLNPATLAIVEGLAQALVTLDVLNEGQTAEDLISILNVAGFDAIDAAAMIDERSAVQLVNGEPSLAPQEFGVSSSAEIMTHETKVR